MIHKKNKLEFKNNIDYNMLYLHQLIVIHIFQSIETPYISNPRRLLYYYFKSKEEEIAKMF